MTTLHIDFETRSACDLKAAGLDNYAKHPSTDAWCMAYAFDNEDVELWAPTGFYHCSDGGWVTLDKVFAHVKAGGTVIAHNASFELAIWNNVMVPRYGWPKLNPEQCRCTMAMAYAMALPGALDNAAAAVGIGHRKDQAGSRLMMQMCRPRSTNPDGTYVWWDEPDKRQALYEYCKQDVRVERDLEKRLMPLSADEQALWVLDQKINDRGVYIDREAVEGAIRVVQAETDRLNAEMRAATDNFVGFCTETARITKWVQRQGVAIEGIAKADVLDALADVDTPPHVKRVLLLRQEAGKSSTAKLRKMIESASSDNRLRGMLQYHGAGTGRWAGRKVQLHNMPRPKIEQEEIEAAIETMRDAK